MRSLGSPDNMVGRIWSNTTSLTQQTLRGVGREMFRLYVDGVGDLYGQFESNPPTLIASLSGGAKSTAVPVGAVFQWISSTAPMGYLMCDGSSASTSGYPKLAAILGSSFGGSFGLPNFNGRVVVGAGAPDYDEDWPGSLTLGATGGTTELRLNIGQLPEHNHTLELAESEHSHTVEVAGHNHTVTSVTVASHAHTLDFATSTAYDVIGEETSLEHDHDSDGPRVWVDADEDSSSDEDSVSTAADLSHTHIPSVDSEGTNDTVTFSISGETMGPDVDETSEDGLHQHGWDIDAIETDVSLDSLEINTDTHGHTVTFDADSKTTADGGHGHSLDVTALGSDHAHGVIGAAEGENIVVEIADNNHHHPIDEQPTGVESVTHDHTVALDAESETEEESPAHTHTVEVAATGSDHSHGIIGAAMDDSNDGVIVGVESDEHTHAIDELITTVESRDHIHTVTFDAESETEEESPAHSHTVAVGATESDHAHGIIGAASGASVIVDANNTDHTHSIDLVTGVESQTHDHTFTGTGAETDTVGGHVHRWDTDNITVSVTDTLDIVNNTTGLAIDIDELDTGTTALGTARVASADLDHSLDTSDDGSETMDSSEDGSETLYSSNTLHYFDHSAVALNDWYYTGSGYQQLEWDGASGVAAYALRAESDDWGGAVDAIDAITSYGVDDLSHTHSVTSDNHSHSVTSDNHSHEVTGTVSIPAATIGLTSSDHQHGIEGSIGLDEPNAGAGHAHTLDGVITATLVHDNAPYAPDGENTYSAGSHSHDFTATGTIGNATVDHTHSIDDADTGVESATHSHTLTGDTEAGGTHTHTGGTGVAGHTHGIDADSLEASVGNASVDHTHSVDGATGNVDEDHTHALSGDTEAGGTHTHNGGTNAAGHTHGIDADSLGALVGNASVDHTHDVDGVTGVEDEGHTHALSGNTEAGGTHTHGGTAVAVGTHTHDINESAIDVLIDSNDGSHTHIFDENSDISITLSVEEDEQDIAPDTMLTKPAADWAAGVSAAHTHDLGSHTHSISGSGTFDLSDEFEIVIANNTEDLVHHHTIGATALDHYHQIHDTDGGGDSAAITGYTTPATDSNGATLEADAGETITTSTDGSFSSSSFTGLTGASSPKPISSVQPYIAMYFIIKHD